MALSPSRGFEIRVVIIVIFEMASNHGSHFLSYPRIILKDIAQLPGIKILLFNFFPTDSLCCWMMVKGNLQLKFADILFMASYFKYMFILFYMCVMCLPVCERISCMSDALGGEKRVLDPQNWNCIPL